MADEPLIFGLALRHYRDLAQIFGRHPKVERVLVFGSRATGQARPESDFDLAVMAPGMSDSEFGALWSEVDALPLAFRVDLLHWDRLGQAALQQTIVSQGQTFWPLPALFETA